MVPWSIVALVCAIILSRTISILSLGDEVATGLGINTTLVKVLSLIIVLILAGGSVIVAGSISFVGLIIPHIVRHFVGTDYRNIIPCCIIFGGLFMVLADIISRLINIPHETPVGLIFSLIGVPFFLYISKKDRRSLNG